MKDRDIDFIKFATISFLSLCWISFVFAILGIFYIWSILGFWLFSLIFMTYKNIIKVKKPSKEILMLITLSIGILIIVFTNYTPNVFTGRDQGSIYTASMALIKNHSLHFHLKESDLFFEIYGPGKALNFPGFHYDSHGALNTQFPIPYIAFLAIFLAIFGSYSGTIIANSILFILFMLYFYGTVKLLLKKTSYAILAIILLLSFPTTLYFTKFSLSENLAETLIFGIIFFIILYKKTKSINYWLLSLFISSLMLFTRIEGLWFFLVTLIIGYKNRQKILNEIIQKQKILVITLSIFIAISLITLFVDFSFYKTMLGVIVQKFQNNPNDSSIDIKTKKFEFLLYTLTYFNLIFPLILTSMFAIYTVMKKEMKLIVLLPIFITSPIFLYFLFPQITLDAPWMLRRYTFAIVPILAIYLAIIAYNTKKTKLNLVYYIVLFVICSYNIFLFLKLQKIPNHPNLIKQAHEISKNFSKDDLILITKNMTGDGFSMLPGAFRNLSQLHSVYFFNPEDYKKIDKSRFNNIYLILPESDLKTYTEILKNKSPKSKIKIKTKFLPSQNKIPITLEPESMIITNYIFKLK